MVIRGSLEGPSGCDWLISLEGEKDRSHRAGCNRQVLPQAQAQTDRVSEAVHQPIMSEVYPMNFQAQTYLRPETPP